jgi:hypothetical protein
MSHQGVKTTVHSVSNYVKNSGINRVVKTHS